MALCSNCAADIIPGAKFCHRCGDQIVEVAKACPVCHGDNPQISVFCHHCGYNFEARKKRAFGYEPIFPLDFQRPVQEQISALFFKNLLQRVQAEQHIAKHSQYLDRFYHTQFREIYDVRTNQIGTEISEQWRRYGQGALPEIDRRLDAAFEGLTDYLFIAYCQDLNKIKLPQAILKYERAAPGKVELKEMVLDYLDFKNELEIVHYELASMPENHQNNAFNKFLWHDRDETLYFVCDLSLKGGCKEGFALTDRAIYWRPAFGKGHNVNFTDLQTVTKEKDYLKINGHFFTANPSLDLKFYKLLNKLKGWEEPSAVEL